MKEYNVGDVVWWAKAGTQQVRRQCPVCLGSLYVIVILGDGEQVRAACDYCGKGYEGPKGYMLEWEWTSGVQKIHISSKQINDDQEGHHVEYRYGDYVLRYDDIFDTEYEANDAIAKKIVEHLKEQEDKLQHSKEFSTKSYAWHVGYHRREKKRAEQAVEYHSSKVISMGKLARVTK